MSMTAEEHVTGQTTDQVAEEESSHSSTRATSVQEEVEIEVVREEQGADDDLPDVIDVSPVPNSPEFEAESFVESVEAAEHELADLQRAYDKRVSAARSDLKRARARHESDIRRAEKDLDRLIASYSARVASFSGVSLYLDRVVFQQQTMPLTPEMNAYCEVKGGIRSASSERRPASGKQLANAKDVVDERELTMYIESASESFEVQCNPDKGDDATRFVQRILSTAAGVNERANERERRVAEAQQEIEDLKADTSEIEEAERVLEEVTGQTEEVDEAQRKLDELEGSASPVEAEALRDSRKRARNRKWLIYGIIVLVVIVVIVLLAVLGR